MDSLVPELFYLILRFLEDGPLRREVFESLRKEIESQNLLPFNACKNRTVNYREMCIQYPGLDSSHLLSICQRLLNNRLDAAKTPHPLLGLTPGRFLSLLGEGPFSILSGDNVEYQKRKGSKKRIIEDEESDNHAFDPVKLTNQPSFRHFRSAKSFEAPVSVFHLQITGRTNNLPFFGSNLFDSKVLFSKFRPATCVMGHSCAIYCFAFDPVRLRFYTGSDDNLIKVWCLRNSLLIRTLRGTVGNITDLTTSNDGKILASSSNSDFFVRLWNVDLDERADTKKDRGYTPKAVLRGHESDITTIKFGKSCFLSADISGVVMIWKLGHWNEPIRKINTLSENQLHLSELHRRLHRRHNHPLWSSTVLDSSSSSSGDFLISAGSQLLFFDTLLLARETQEEMFGSVGVGVLQEKAGRDKYLFVEISNNGHQFCTGENDGSVHLFSLKPFIRRHLWHDICSWNHSVLFSLIKNPCSDADDLDPEEKRTLSCVWSCDDKMIAVSLCLSQEHSIHVYNSADGSLLHDLTKHKDSVFVLKAHPHDPRILLSADYNGLICLWDIVTGSILGSFNCNIDGEKCECTDGGFSPCGNYIVITGTNGKFSLFSTGNLLSYRNCFSEQFFRHDYTPLISDQYGGCLDEDSNEPPHFLDNGPLCNALLIPYDEQYIPPSALSVNVLSREDIVEANSNEVVNAGMDVNITSLEEEVEIEDDSISEEDFCIDQDEANEESSSFCLDDSLDVNISSEEEKDTQLNEHEIWTSTGDRREKYDKRGFVVSDYSTEPSSSSSSRRRPLRLRKLRKSRIVSEEESNSEEASSYVNVEESDFQDYYEKTSESKEKFPENVNSSVLPIVDKDLIRSRRQIMDTSKPHPWLSKVSQNLLEYLPQVGDHVYYFPEAHRSYFEAGYVYEKKSQNILPFSWLNTPVNIQCMVESIDYETFPWLHVILSLEITSPEFLRGKKWNGIRYHVADVPDFIVLKELVDRSMKVSCEPGESVGIWYDDLKKFCYATVTKVEDTPGSSFFESVHVYYTKDKAEDRVSPWELLRCDKDEFMLQKNLRFSDIDEIVNDQMITNMENLMSEDYDCFCDFRYPFDFESYPDYLKSHPYYVDFSLLLSRLQNRYYRTISSVRHDARFLVKNAIDFNVDGSNIHFVAIFLSKVLSNAIEYPFQPLIPGFSMDVSLNMLPAEDDKHGKDKSPMFENEGGNSVEKKTDQVLKSNNTKRKVMVKFPKRPKRKKRKY